MSVRRAISLSGLGMPASVRAEAVSAVEPHEILVFTTSERDPSQEMVAALSDIVRDTWPRNKAVLLAGDLTLDILWRGRLP